MPKKKTKRRVTKSTARKTSPATKSRRRKHRKLKDFFSIVGIFRLAVTIGIWGFLLLSIAIVYYAHDLPDISEIAKHERKPQITIRSDDGTILANYGDIHGNYLTYGQIPIFMTNAVVATEDRRFFKHFGVDVWGIVRAYFANLKAGRVVQGGSTITQQLAKIVFLSPERTIKRKVQEVLMALQLEHKFSKEQILTIYLNRVYLGKGNFGIDAAARYYYGKYAEYLNLYESAVLAGMLKAPSRYSPGNNPDLAVKRARKVLEKMHDAGFISKEELKKAIPPKFVERGSARGALENPYFTDYVLSLVPELVRNTKQDLTIYTTLDINAQKALEKSILKLMEGKDEQSNAQQAAGIVMESNGAIKAMVGGKSYKKSQFNRAVLAQRQPGSAFKFFVYLTGLENGYDVYDSFEDEPVEIYQGKNLPLWKPRNFSRKYGGSTTLKEGFTKSINIISVKLSEEVGRQKVIEMARRLGITTRLPGLASIALGACEVNLLELTQAYAHIANNGYKTRGFAITKITDDKHNVVFEHPGLSRKQLIDDWTVGNMKELLNSVVEYGTGRGARLYGKTAFGKSGTSQDYRDAWFVGYSGDIVTGIWVGNDDNSAMKRVLGGTIPAKIWQDFMSSVGKIHATPVRKIQSHGQESIFDSIFGNPKQNHVEPHYHSMDELIEDIEPDHHH